MMRFGIILFVLLSAACAPDAERAQPTAPSGEAVETVTSLMAAFNDHDADKMREHWQSDVTWVEVTGNQSSVVTSSANQLHQELVRYFETFPSVTSSLENISVNGNYVTATETPVWEESGVRKSQASIVVYEVLNGRVKRFWYFPPQ